jgi:hypothetical protein
MHGSRRLAEAGVGVMVAGLLLVPGGKAGAAHSDFLDCSACHVPHNADATARMPLWNGNETAVTFIMYTSATFQGTIEIQPCGTSRLCLSCHDGANPNYRWMAGARTFGANDLVNSHPISFVYDSELAQRDGFLKDPSLPSTLGQTIAQDLLDTEGKLQCTSCHDVHASGVGEHQLRGYDYGYATVTNPDGTTSQVYRGVRLCRMCHLR